MREIAARRIQTGRERDYSTPVWLLTMARAHQDLGEHEEAVELLERAVRASGQFGPLRSRMIYEVERARQMALRARRAEADAAAGVMPRPQ
jgi:hypothetical protein